jgi:hypothetical protein
VQDFFVTGWQTTLIQRLSPSALPAPSQTQPPVLTVIPLLFRRAHNREQLPQRFIDASSVLQHHSPVLFVPGVVRQSDHMQ